ncbi:MAG TPA: HAD-IA family hydrolase, partial [Spirochaetia bacterium]|nr:HAD-IA family hydrolase [Spirochaetia bacterium]
LQELKAARFASLFERLDTRGDAEAVSLHYLTSLSTRAYFLPGARDVLNALSRTSALCLVTNGISLVQRGRLERSGVAGLFRAVLISEELGFAKPDPRFFQAATDSLSLPADSVLCVGDNPAADIAGAQSAGIDACWYAPSGAPWPGPGRPPALVIRDLAEVLPLAAPMFTKNAI